MQLVILGGTGSGKGTQTAKIRNNIIILSISTGKLAQAYMDRKRGISSR